MEEHRPKKLLDQVRARSELGEGMPSASNTVPGEPNEPTATGAGGTIPEYAPPLPDRLWSGRVCPNAASML